MDKPSAPTSPKINDPIIGLFVRKWKWSDTKIILLILAVSSAIMIGAGSIASSQYSGVGEKIASLGNIGFVSVWILFFLPLLWSMYLWQIRAAHSVLENLKESNVIVHRDSKQIDDIANIQISLLQRLGRYDVYLFAIVFLVVFWFYELTVVWPDQFKIMRQFWYDVSWYFPLHIFAWTIGLYALSVIIVRQLIIVFRISNFIKTANLQLEILHADSAGGLGAIGRVGAVK